MSAKVVDARVQEAMDIEVGDAIYVEINGVKRSAQRSALSKLMWHIIVKG